MEELLANKEADLSLGQQPHHGTPAAAAAATATAAAVDAAGVVGTALEPGPVQVLKQREELSTVELYDTYLLQSEADPLMGGS